MDHLSVMKVLSEICQWGLTLCWRSYHKVGQWTFSLWWRSYLKRVSGPSLYLWWIFYGKVAQWTISLWGRQGPIWSQLVDHWFPFFVPPPIKGLRLIWFKLFPGSLHCAHWFSSPCEPGSKLPLWISSGSLCTLASTLYSIPFQDTPPFTLNGRSPPIKALWNFVWMKRDCFRMTLATGSV